MICGYLIGLIRLEEEPHNTQPRFIWYLSRKNEFNSVYLRLLSLKILLILQMVLCIFCILNSILTLVRAFSFAYGGLKAAVRVHSALICKLINAPIQFFDQTPSGRILNRLVKRKTLFGLCVYCSLTYVCFFLVHLFQILLWSIYNRWLSTVHPQHSSSKFCWLVRDCSSVVLCSGLFHKLKVMFFCFFFLLERSC